jgi:hypothetical protein
MPTASLLLLAALSTAGAPSGARAERSAEWVRSYVATYTARSLKTAHLMIPAWARKYNMNCSGCHFPAPPRLNATGIRFKWAGYRMPEEVGEKVDVERIQNYLAAGAEATYEYEKTEGQPTTASGFTLPAVTVFYAGPFGKHYGGFLELEHGPEGEIERIAQFSTVWGKQKSYGGFRFGQMHNFVEWGVAGFDRPVGISTPSPLENPLTAAVPFMLGEHALGVEGYYVTGSNRLSAQVLNGITPGGELAGPDFDTRKDFLVTDQILTDSAGSGIQAMGYYGTLVGLDTLSPGLASHFWRAALSANKIYRGWEVLGGVVIGKDFDLPAAAPEDKGLGYWFSGQYSFPKSSLTLFGRYEFVDPNTDVSADANRRFVAGVVLPINLPQYLRWALEYRLDNPQGGLPKTSNITAQFLINF